VTVSAGGSTLATVSIQLTVWNFVLPSTSSLRSYYGLYYGDLLAQHRVSGDAFSTLRARYAQLGLDHRVSISGFDDGNYDPSHIAQFYGGLIDGTAPTQLPGAKLTSVKYMGSISASGYASWATFFKGRGWFDRLFDYTCDEPPATCAWSDIPARNALMKAADPNFPSLVTTDAAQAAQNGVLSSIDILAPVINFMDGKSAQDPGGWNDQYSGLQRSSYDTFLSATPINQVWMYQSCMSHGCGGTSAYFTGWPSYMIDTQSMRSRAMEWLSFAWNTSGELYWESTYAYGFGDPWTSQDQFGGNGDGTLFYPGTPAKIGGQTDIPVASLRLKMIRAGMQDFEYLKLLSDSGDPTLAQNLAAQLFPNAWTEPTVADLLAARATIAARIVALGGGNSSTQTAGTSSSTAANGAPSNGSSSNSANGASASNQSTTAAGSATKSGCSSSGGEGLCASLGLIAVLASRRRARRIESR